MKRTLSPEENKLLNTQEKKAQADTLASGPVRISLNMTGKCNIRCVYCHLTFADYATKAELDAQTFMKLGDSFPSLSHLVYFSSTEPLMAKHFPAIFEASVPIPAEKYLSTNGILLDEETAEMFVKGGLEFLTISFGGLTRDSFIAAHQVDKLDVVTENIEKLNRLKEKYRKHTPRLRLVYVTWKDNAHELPEAVRYAYKHKFSEGIKITYLKAYTDDMIDQIPFDHMPEVQKYVREAQALGRELNVPITFDGGNFDDVIGGEGDVAEAATGVQYHRPCYEPWERMHVEADGTVHTCPDPINTHVAGDLRTQTLEEIWNGPVYQEFRRRVNSDDPMDVCKRCTHNFHKDFSRRDIWDLRDADLGMYKRLEKGRSYLKSRHAKKKTQTNQDEK